MSETLSSLEIGETVYVVREDLTHQDGDEDGFMVREASVFHPHPEKSTLIIRYTTDALPYLAGVCSLTRREEIFTQEEAAQIVKDSMGMPDIDLSIDSLVGDEMTNERLAALLGAAVIDRMASSPAGE